MRGKPAKKREIKKDEIYGSELVTKFTNLVMKDGKKNAATKVMVDALEELKKVTKENEVESLEKAIENVKPKMEVRSKRVGGANFQVPLPVAPGRAQALAIRWILDSARKNRGNKPFAMSLSRELVDAYKKEGAAMKKREETHKMAEANKAFSQFA